MNVEDDTQSETKRTIVAVEKTGEKVSWFNCQFNLTNSAIGAGVLYLPSVFGQVGYILGKAYIYIYI